MIWSRILNLFFFQKPGIYSCYKSRIKNFRKPSLFFFFSCVLKKIKKYYSNLGTSLCWSLLLPIHSRGTFY